MSKFNYADLSIPALVLLIMGMLVLPLPPFLLDVLFTFNITSSVLNSFGSSGIISVFASTWTVTLICLATGILLIYRKERL